MELRYRDAFWEMKSFLFADYCPAGLQAPQWLSGALLPPGGGCEVTVQARVIADEGSGGLV